MKLGVLSPREWCDKYGIPFLWPFTEEDEYGLIYDAVTGRLQVVDKDDAKVRILDLISIKVLGS